MVSFKESSFDEGQVDISVNAVGVANNNHRSYYGK